MPSVRTRASLRIISVLTTVGLVAGLLYALAPAASASTCTPTSGGDTTCTFTFTGAEQTFAVPEGVSTLHITAIGAAGGLGLYDSTPPAVGKGATVTGDVAVSPGSTLYVEVGGTPTTGGCYPGVPCVGGFNGGGSSHYGGGGGGASDVRTVARADGGTLDSRLLVAAGGGGSGEEALCDAFVFPNGGYGGDAGAAGGTGGACVSTAGGTGGGAGTDVAGGAGGSPSGGAGSQGIGGNGGSNTGGGGGGGLFGGGGGGNFTLSGTSDLNAAGGGGGGSNLIPGGGSAALTTDPAGITIMFTPPTTALSIEAPTKVKDGANAKITGMLSSGVPACASTQKVKLEANGKNLGKWVTASDGAYKFKVAIKKKTVVQVLFKGTTTCAASVSETRTIKVT